MVEKWFLSTPMKFCIYRVYTIFKYGFNKKYCFAGSKEAKRRISEYTLSRKGVIETSFIILLECMKYKYPYRKLEKHFYTLNAPRARATYFAHKNMMYNILNDKLHIV